MKDFYDTMGDIDGFEIDGDYYVKVVALDASNSQLSENGQGSKKFQKKKSKKKIQNSR